MNLQKSEIFEHSKAQRTFGAQKNKVFLGFQRLKSSKKAQTEVIGIAIIVLILVIAAAFILSQKLKQKAPDSASFIDPKIAQGFLNTILKVKTEKNIVVSDVISYCHEAKKRDLCDGDCCNYAHDTIKNALDASLKKWQREYYFTIRQGNTMLIEDISAQNCGIYSEKKQPGFNYIPAFPQITVSLYLCK
ncbi:MAG: hypothetical protein AABW92_02200 [Nanoarchaeota archaeon]